MLAHGCSNFFLWASRNIFGVNFLHKNSFAGLEKRRTGIFCCNFNSLMQDIYLGICNKNCKWHINICKMITNWWLYLQIFIFFYWEKSTFVSNSVNFEEKSTFASNSVNFEGNFGVCFCIFELARLDRLVTLNGYALERRYMQDLQIMRLISEAKEI